jgi:ATP-binding cassette, subfamily B, bacterial
VRRAVQLAAPFGPRIAVLLVVVVLQQAAMILPPLLLKRLIDDGVLRGDGRLVTGLAMAVAGLEVASAGLGLAAGYLAARVGEGLVFTIRARLCAHVERLPISFFTHTRTGALISRVTNDVQGAEQAFTSTLPGVAADVVSLVLLTVAMVYLSWQVTLAGLILLPLFLYLAKHAGRRLGALTERWMGHNADFSALVGERFSVAGALLVRLSSRPGAGDAQLVQSAGRLRDVGVNLAMIERVFSLSLTLVAALATVSVYLVGGHFAIRDRVSLGTLLALTALLGRLYGPLSGLSGARVAAATALVSFERIFELLDLRPAVRQRPGAVTASSDDASVEFDHVSFRYPTAQAATVPSLRLEGAEGPHAITGTLWDVSFRVASGRHVALVGPSGAGKSTVAHLVARLYDATGGAVRIGGRDVRDLTQESLAATVGVISQDAHLFHATVRENLLVARPDAVEAELVRACRAAQLWDLVASLPDGLDTVVGQHGYLLSGGEKQRVAIARLLLKAPRVVVLDEATAHLDVEVEAAIQHMLHSVLRDHTCLIITHRLPTVRDCDEILVLDGGRVVERGRHEELLAAQGLYAVLHNVQSQTELCATSEEKVLSRN